MSSIDPDEAIAIVKELAESNKIIGDDLEPYAITCNQEMIDRILAAVKPKGPFPVEGILTWTIGSGVGGEHLVGNLPQGVPDDGGFQEVRITGNDMDRLVVAWLQHRGVDVERVVADLRFHEEANDLDNSLSAALQSILDNAEASE